MNKEQVALLQQDVEAALQKHYTSKGGSWSVEPLGLGGAGLEINIGSGSMEMEMHEVLISLAKKHNTSYATEADIENERPTQFIYMESLENKGMLHPDEEKSSIVINMRGWNAGELELLHDFLRDMGKSDNNILRNIVEWSDKVGAEQDHH